MQIRDDSNEARLFFFMVWIEKGTLVVIQGVHHKHRSHQKFPVPQTIADV